MEDQAMVAEVGGLAAAARTSMYALRLDHDAFDASESRVAIDAGGDRSALLSGLETLAGAARGAVFNVVNSGAQVFERIETELAGYYLLGVESDPRDHDGKAHPIRVEVARHGATVRTRRQIVTTAAESRPRNAREAVAQALTSPLLLSALPVRVATYSLRGADAGHVAAAHTRRCRRRLLSQPPCVDRVHAVRSNRAAGRQPGGGSASLAGIERRPVAAAIHGRRKRRRRASTR